MDADLPKQLWAEAVSTAAYVQNLLPSAATKTTPHELWHGAAPDVSALRVFECLCYVHVPDKVVESRSTGGGNKRQKRDYRAVRGIFVGYAAQQLDWRVLDCETATIVPSVDVTFD